MPVFPAVIEMPRRSYLGLLFCAVVLLAASAASARPLTPVPVGERAFAFIGSGGIASTENLGEVGNSGFFVGPSGVVVVDTGASQRHGERMIEAIRRVTDLPIVLVIITHAVQDVVFGAGAFTDIGVAVGAHRATIDLMKARCQHCLDNLRALLGDELAGTRLVLPTIAWTGSTRIGAGGLDLELLHFGWAATPGDIAVFDRPSGTLFAGGLADVAQVPDLRDCDFAGWRQTIDRLRALPLRYVVPGHGPVSGPAALADTDAYLAALDRKVRALYERTPSLLEALDQSELPEYAGWAAYAPTHRRNVLHRYLQIEIEDLGGDPRSTAVPQR